ncbi:GGDEF domain-containing protein [Alginatibacterium sediminis]|uniref:diguanylate cyclase n=1 Tax=Alginatibacterium sediminis TaxID=2164068 RepID=A0A420EGX3_9ALTE|nr:GGDEF domain-containing protein [Alginatibacterium sediminis]RKF19914.1 GGDEF domain-containing protein [Alginatibacterium sediminis]
MSSNKTRFYHKIGWRVTFSYALLSFLLIALSIFSVQQISSFLQIAKHSEQVELPNLKSSTSIQLMATELESKARLVIASATISQTRLYLQQSAEIFDLLSDELARSQQSRNLLELNELVQEMENTLRQLVAIKQQLIDDNRDFKDSVESIALQVVPLARAAVLSGQTTPVTLYIELTKLRSLEKPFERTKSRISLTRLTDALNKEIEQYPAELHQGFYSVSKLIEFELIEKINSVNQMSRQLNGLSTQFKVLLSAMASNSRKDYNAFENKVSQNTNLLVNNAQYTVKVLLWLIAISFVLMALNLRYLHRALFLQSRKLSRYLGQQSLSEENINEFDRRNEIGLLARTIYRSQQTVVQQKLELQHSNELLAKILEHVDLAVVLIHGQVIQACNFVFQNEFSAQIGQSSLNIPGLSEQLIQHDLSSVGDQMQQLGEVYYDEQREHWYQINAIEVHWEQKPSLLLMIKDVTEEQLRVQNYQYNLSQAQHDALIDSLSSLYNRKRYDMECQNQHSGLLKQGFSLLVLDIDNFKIYNDTLGHSRGDEVIRQVSKVLTSSIRETDLAIRYGGEEFVLIQHGSDVNDAKQLAQRVADRLEQLRIPHPIAPGVYVTFSIGCTDSSQADSLEACFSLADSRLYEAKEAGRNCIR